MDKVPLCVVELESLPLEFFARLLRFLWFLLLDVSWSVAKLERSHPPEHW